MADAAVIDVNGPRLAGGDQRLPDPGWRAIAHAQAMDFDDADACFRGLYDFGAEPMTPEHAGAPDAAAPVLSAPMRAMLGCRFRHDRSGVWHVWSRDASAGAPIWKAYLNPRFADLPAFALRIAPALLDPRVVAFKMVAQRWMALRPDKVMVYFDCPAARAEWIDDTLPELAGIAANPVPFTTPHDTRGLVTVATDPAHAPGDSWRSWLLRQVAEMLLDPRRPDLHAELRRIGVAPRTWERTDGHT